MKKIGIAVVLLAVATSGFAIDLSAGVGVSAGGFWSIQYYEDYFVIYDVLKIAAATVPFGISAWFDATYGVVSVGFRASGDTRTTTTSDGFLGPDESAVDDQNRSGYLAISLIGRYPFDLGPVTLFPLLGIECDVNLYWKADDGTDLKAALPEEERPWLNQFWFKGGVGADIPLVEGLYLRPTVLLGFKTLNQDERDTIQTAIDSGGANVARKTNFVLEAGLQAGWRF